MNSPVDKAIHGITILAAIVLMVLVAFDTPARAQDAIGDSVAPAPALATQSDKVPPTDTLRADIELADTNVDDSPLDWATLRTFYAQRKFAFAWSDGFTLNANGRAALDVVEHAADEGLNPATHHADYLRNARLNSPESVVEYEIVLSDGFLRYAHDVRVGRVSAKDVDGDVAVPDEKFDAVAQTDLALAQNRFDSFVHDLPPPHPEYAALKTMLAQYRGIEAGGGWPTISGSSERRLRRRLIDEDPSLEQTGGGAAQALKQFQARHGLAQTGALDERTRNSLNVPVADRIAEIEANMERWRWLPRQFAARRVVVNVPSASLKVIDGDNQVLMSRVVVGRQDDPTPILIATANAVTINPIWHVPTDIADSDVVPKLAEDRHYLRKQHMVAARFGGETHYRQLPGPQNALGPIKIEMPNQFSVYLHGTPEQAAFDQRDRDWSHGCMRVEEIEPLASYALTGDPDAGMVKLSDMIASHVTRHVPIPKPLPVYALYWTVSAEADGMVHFWPDLYGRDVRLIALLNTDSKSRSLAMANSESERGF